MTHASEQVVDSRLNCFNCLFAFLVHVHLRPLPCYDFAIGISKNNADSQIEIGPDRELLAKDYDYGKLCPTFQHLLQKMHLFLFL
jgi:hypothetical protein